MRWPSSNASLSVIFMALERWRGLVLVEVLLVRLALAASAAWWMVLSPRRTAAASIGSARTTRARSTLRAEMPIASAVMTEVLRGFSSIAPFGAIVEWKPS